MPRGESPDALAQITLAVNKKSEPMRSYLMFAAMALREQRDTIGDDPLGWFGGTVTVYIEPLPAKLVISAPITPVAAKTRSAVSTPLTSSLKVTVKSTLAAAVGFKSARTIEATTGKVLSKVYISPPVKSPT